MRRNLSANSRPQERNCTLDKGDNSGDEDN